MLSVLSMARQPRKRVVIITAAVVALLASALTASADSVVQYTVGTGVQSPSLYLYLDPDYCNFVAFDWHYWMTPEINGSSSSVYVYSVDVHDGSATSVPNTTFKWNEFVEQGSDGTYRYQPYYPGGTLFNGGSENPTVDADFPFTSSSPATITAVFSNQDGDLNCTTQTTLQMFPY